MGASYIAPNYWYLNGGAIEQFSKLGEYQIVWDKTSFYTCDRVETVTTGSDGIAMTSVSYTRSNQRQESDNNTTCSMNLTVTKPYTTQQNGLSVSTDDEDIMSSII